MASTEDGRLTDDVDDQLLDEEPVGGAEHLVRVQPDGDGARLGELLALHERGAHEAGIAELSQLCEKHREPIVSQMRRYVGPNDDVEPLFPMVSVHAWSAIASVRPGYDVGAWLREMAKQAILAYCRKNDREQIRTIREQVNAKHLEEANDTFRQLFDRYHAQIHSYIARLVSPQRDLAEDLTQDVLETVWLWIQDECAWTNFRSWIFTVATNAVRDHARQQKRRQSSIVPWARFGARESKYRRSSDSTSPQEALACVEDLLARGMPQVDKQHGMWLLLCDYHGFTAAEAAAIVAEERHAACPLPEGTVHWHISTAKRQFRKAFPDSADGPSSHTRRPQSRRPERVTAPPALDTVEPAEDNARVDARVDAIDVLPRPCERRQRAQRTHDDAQKLGSDAMKEGSRDGSMGE